MRKEIKTAAIYARVSTVNQGQDPTMQTRELREYCKRRGLKIAGEFVDRASGAKESRPELDKLMKAVHERRHDVVVVWRFDRFARSVSHLLKALETFKSLGIEFVSLCEQVDTSTPTGKMVFTVLGAVAELERALTVERVKAGIRNAIAKGIKVGRPPLRTFSADEIQQIRKARRKNKVSVRQLAIQFGTTQWMVNQVASGK